MKAYVFPASRAQYARIKLDEFNASEPLPIYRGPHEGKMFLDELNLRDERWVPLFGPLIADPANDVHLVDLDEADIVAPEIHL